MTTLTMVFGILLAIAVITIGALMSTISSLKSSISLHLKDKGELRTELERSQLTRDAILKHRDELIEANLYLKDKLHSNMVRLEEIVKRYKAMERDFAALLADSIVSMIKPKMTSKGKATKKGKDKPPSSATDSTHS